MKINNDMRSDISEAALFTPDTGNCPPTRFALSVDQMASGLTTADGGAFRWWQGRANGEHPVRAISLLAIYRSIVIAATTDLERGIAFLFVPVFLALGVLGYFSLTFEIGLLRPLMAVMTLACACYLARRRHNIFLCLAAILLFAIGVTVSKIETWRAGTMMLGSEISTALTGRVVSVESLASGRIRLTLDVISTARPKLRYQPDRVRLSTRKIPQGLKAGSTINGYVRLFPPTGPVRPGSYDFSFKSYFAGIGASGFFLSKLQLLPDTPTDFSARMLAAVENIRNGIAAHIRSQIDGPEGSIAAALIVGVRSGIPEVINEAMRKTGIYHIISISGLHMALVAGTIMALFRGVFALFPGFSSRRPVKKYAAAIAILCIAAYLLISGVSVAAERSFIMLAVMLSAVLFDRAALTMRNLAISAIVVILLSPHEVIGPSFQMSFAATAALVGAYAALTDYRARKISSAAPVSQSLTGALGRRFLMLMGGLAITSIVAGCATTLFAMWHFQRVSPLSLFANLAVMPIVSMVVMPFAVISSLLMPLGADWPFLYVVGKGLTLMIAISGWIAKQSPIDAIGLISLQSVLLGTVALIIATMATTWLRLIAIPFALFALLTIGHVRTPDVLVSEDGRLVAFTNGDTELEINQARPSKFVLDNWRRALFAETIIKPTISKSDAKPADFKSQPLDAAFSCSKTLCVATHRSGSRIAYAKTKKAAKTACAFASLIIIDDATVANPCKDRHVAVITKRQLARYGSAAVFFDDEAKSAARPSVEFAVETTYRPWHIQRQFSREARGLAPYRRTKKSKKPQVATH